MNEIVAFIDDTGIVATMEELLVKIVQGSQSSFLLRLYNQTNGVLGDPVDLTTMYDIKTCFQNSDGTETTLSKLTAGIAVVGSPLLGKITVSLTAAQTALLALSDPGELQISLIATLGADPVKIDVRNAYDVVETTC